jgi:uncharacterized protein YndB with AHSA1/START domain
MTNPLHFEIYIKAGAPKVWAALTQSPGVGKLYFGCKLVTTFAKGAPYSYAGDDGAGGVTSHVEGEILACDENKRLALTHRAGPMWRKDGRVFTSRLAYTLDDVGYATKLTIDHDEWEDGDPGYAHNAAGWMVFLSSVKSYVETGEPLAIPLG